ncbi:MAG: 3'(2'),5'-bisphosphate nucleotidase CysQ [Fibrobacterota bacterium]
MDMNLIEEHLRKISLQAGTEILAVYKRDFTPQQKEDNTPLTEADINSNTCITAGLKELNRLLGEDIPILSEETTALPWEQRKHWKRLWIVDPLDGTKEFIKKNGEFTTNIALVEAGTPIAGAVYAPVPDTFYFAAAESGARMQKNASAGTQAPTELKLSPKLPDREITALVSRSHRDERTNALLSRLEEAGLTVKTLSRGSTLKQCTVAAGQAQLYPRLAPTMEWDTAAAQIICTEAGAEIRDTETGQEPIYNKKNLKNNHFLLYHKELRMYL